MSFLPKAGCPMCGLVAGSRNSVPSSPISRLSSDSTQPEVLWHDDNFTAYREKANPISSKGHVIIVFNLHVPSLYTLSASDLPLLSHIKSLGRRLLSSLTGSASPSGVSPSPSSATFSNAVIDDSKFRIGFITPPWKDNKIPVTDHLHAHAYIAPADLLGWWRGMAYGPLAWYAIDDLIAEIREESTNNRVKSGYAHRGSAPIDAVPDAGARTGTADGREITDTGLSAPDIEAGLDSPAGRPRTPTSALSP